MRAALGFFLAGLVGCGLTPPCGRVAKAVCDIGAEGGACSFLLHRERNDIHAQEVCREIEPAARAYAADRRSGGEAWAAARGRLVELGMRADGRQGDIATKLKDAGGEAGRLVRKIEAAYELGEKGTREGAERAFDAER